MRRTPPPPASDDLRDDARDDDLDATAEPPSGVGNEKLQRWVDLLASLLARTTPARFEELAPAVPEYRARLEEAAGHPTDSDEHARITESLKRSFERDKDELRRFGVPIESLPDADGNAGGTYRLRRASFYLPYLTLAVPEGADPPRKVQRWGYNALATLAFEADELQAVVDAAACVRGLGDPLLAADVESALRKLAVDLPVDAATVSPDEPRVVLPRARPGAAVFEALADAVARRKVAAFDYHAMSTDATETREVEPYGLFFLHGHWYLVGRDRARGATRNFRLNRVGRVKVNAKRPQTPDFELPADFRLREHARARQPWELGDADPVAATVELRGDSGPTHAARTLGRADDVDGRRRVLEVRRPEAFVRWTLAFAGEMVPLSPPDIVARWRAELERTAALYAREAPAVEASVADAPAAGAAKRARRGAARDGEERWQPQTAAAQLRRILHVVPQLEDGKEHPLAEVAARVGTTVEGLRRDIYSLVDRFDLPAGFVEGVSLGIEAERVWASASHFARPMRLTVSELCALELGVAVLQARRPPDEHAVLARARARLRDVIARLPGDPIPDGLYGVSLGEQGSTAHLAAVRRALREGRKLRLVYRKSGSDEAGERVVCPYALVAASGMLYVVAHCEQGRTLKVFRMDRVEAAEPTDEPFAMPEGFSVEAVVREGRAFVAPHAGRMRVRYSPRVARWIAEREGRTLDADGSLVLEHPLADEAWGLRHLLQYGPEAEVLEPASMRERMRARVAEMLADA